MRWSTILSLLVLVNIRMSFRCALPVAFAVGFLLCATLTAQQSTDSPIKFELKELPFHLESDVSKAFNPPETMAGGVAVFDYNGDGRPDIFFTNGADLATLKKTSPNIPIAFTATTAMASSLMSPPRQDWPDSGFDIGVAVGDYDNDGHPDLFVSGVHGNTLYHNNGDGTFTDVTRKAGLDKWNDPQYGPLWSVAAAWVDVNNDGLLDLFVVNYLQWTYSDKPLCTINDVPEYCHPRYYKGLPDQLFHQPGRRHLQGCFEGVGPARPHWQRDGRRRSRLRSRRQAGSVCHQRRRIQLPFP